MMNLTAILTVTSLRDVTVITTPQGWVVEAVRAMVPYARTYVGFKAAADRAAEYTHLGIPTEVRVYGLSRRFVIRFL